MVVVDGDGARDGFALTAGCGPRGGAAAAEAGAVAGGEVCGLLINGAADAEVGAIEEGGDGVTVWRMNDSANYGNGMNRY